jgi:hypothetical protein
MLTELYVEALLVSEVLADRVWKSWDAGDIDDETAATSWASIAVRAAHACSYGRPDLRKPTCPALPAPKRHRQ